MTNFIVIEKDSLDKVTVNAERITLSEASIVHAKMQREDVVEFLRDGNNLILKLVNGEIVVIENFFTTYDDVASDLVFEEEGCVLYWFDGVSGFEGIPGLEVLLPTASAAQLGGLLPWLAGAAVVGGIAAAIADNDRKHNHNDHKIDDGTLNVVINPNGKITGTTTGVPADSDVLLTIKGKDANGNDVEINRIVQIDENGNYNYQLIPTDGIADGSTIDVEAVTTDRNGNSINDTDTLAGTGLDLVPGSIEVSINPDNTVSGTTTDVPVGSDVTIT
ncbi:BapA/Bap/LapF family prefix-like domain-containing protein, partial [Acinetobacter haemolyticus]|uniref:BapA/Bap/LapF family prefix-like domain-containing protein n=1 Tax=Acinetobacter haemolyticus TaxID=29430 RepID=UPI003C213470